jgi:hypothetical protein
MFHHKQNTSIPGHSCVCRDEGNIRGAYVRERLLVGTDNDMHSTFFLRLPGWEIQRKNGGNAPTSIGRKYEKTTIDLSLLYFSLLFPCNCFFMKIYLMYAFLTTYGGSFWREEREHLLTGCLMDFTCCVKASGKKPFL